MLNIFARSFLGAFVGGLLNQILVFLMRTQMMGFVPGMFVHAAVQAAIFGLLFAVLYSVVHLMIGKPTVRSSLMIGMIFAVSMAVVAFRHDQFDLIPLNYALTVMLGLLTGGGAAVFVLNTKSMAKTDKTNRPS